MMQVAPDDNRYVDAQRSRTVHVASLGASQRLVDAAAAAVMVFPALAARGFGKLMAFVGRADVAEPSVFQLLSALLRLRLRDASGMRPLETALLEVLF